MTPAERASLLARILSAEQVDALYAEEARLQKVRDDAERRLAEITAAIVSSGEARLKMIRHLDGEGGR